MKKLLSIALMLFVGMMVRAQEGHWSTGMVEADELTGQKAGEYYRFTIDSIGSITIPDWNGWSFQLNSADGMFDSWIIHGSVRTIICAKFLMGLYDANGKLVEKYQDDMAADHNDGSRTMWIDTSWPYTPGKRRKLKRMISAMRNGDGYVRIVVKRRNRPDFDLKVTPYIKQLSSSISIK